LQEKIPVWCPNSKPEQKVTTIAADAGIVTLLNSRIDWSGSWIQLNSWWRRREIKVVHPDFDLDRGFDSWT